MIKKPAAEKTLVNILQQDPESVLAFIQNKVQQLTKLDQIWRVEIPNELSKHTRVANFRDGYLIIECDSAAWATHLHYRLPNITQKLLKHPNFHNLTHIESNIQPLFHTQHTHLSQLSPTLSSASAELLKNAADAIPVKALQEALLRIAQHKN